MSGELLSETIPWQDIVVGDVVLDFDPPLKVAKATNMRYVTVIATKSGDRIRVAKLGASATVRLPRPEADR